MSSIFRLLLAAATVFFVATTTAKLQEVENAQSRRNSPTSVTFDGRSFSINDERILFIGGSFHYTRAPRAEWPSIFQQAKDNGINLIQTYVFWDIHEPENDVFFFPSSPSSGYDLVAFVKEAAAAGLYVHLRIAGYVCAEWNFGGIPVWMKDLKCTFRSYDEIWLEQLVQFMEATINVIKQAKLLATQGGPIVMLQIENEYGNMEKYYGLSGRKYVEWLAAFTDSIDVGGLPWVMCQQGEGVGSAPPAGIINTCNGFYCDNWIEQHANDFPNQPHMWTENWPGWFQKWGEAVPHRPAVDVAFAVARWFAKGGTYMNYYMAFGGTTFGRSAGGPKIITSYDYDVQINEYGMRSEPKFSLLQSLHKVLQENSQILLAQSPPATIPLSGFPNCEAHIYRISSVAEDSFHLGSNQCIAFLSNWDEEVSCPFYLIDADAGLTISTHVAPWSVSILTGSNCSTEVYNTKTSAKKIIPNEMSPTAVQDFEIQSVKYFSEPAPYLLSQSSTVSSTSALWPLEQLSLTNDTTDYLWYSTILPNAVLQNISPTSSLIELQFLSGGSGSGNVYYIFLNGQYIESVVSDIIETSLAPHQSTTDTVGDGVTSLLTDVFPGEFLTIGFEVPPDLLPFEGNASLQLDILSAAMGLKNYGPYLEHIKSGILSNVTANKELLSNFVHFVGLQGESSRSDLSIIDHASPLSWSEVAFPTPASVDNMIGTLALDLGQVLGKGIVWINGNMIGRYWNVTAPVIGCETCYFMKFVGSYSPERCRSGCGYQSQRYYKLPVEWLRQPSGSINKLVLFDELGGSPSKIRLVEMIMTDVY